MAAWLHPCTRYGRHQSEGAGSLDQRPLVVFSGFSFTESGGMKPALNQSSWDEGVAGGGTARSLFDSISGTRIGMGVATDESER